MHPVQTILERLTGMASTFIALLPQIVLAMVVVLLTWAAGRASGRLVAWLAEDHACDRH